jgi:GTPase SAR1 family protein
VFRFEYGLAQHGYVIVYSITSLRSFNIAKDINMQLFNLTGAPCPRVLVGNKADLEDERQRCAAGAPHCGGLLAASCGT